MAAAEAELAADGARLDAARAELAERKAAHRARAEELASQAAELARQREALEGRARAVADAEAQAKVHWKRVCLLRVARHGLSFVLVRTVPGFELCAVKMHIGEWPTLEIFLPCKPTVKLTVGHAPLPSEACKPDRFNGTGMVSGSVLLEAAEAFQK